MLKYIGNGKHIPTLPARDLSNADVERYAGSIGLSVAATKTLLIDRGLYQSPPKTKTKKKDSE